MPGKKKFMEVLSCWEYRKVLGRHSFSRGLSSGTTWDFSPAPLKTTSSTSTPLTTNQKPQSPQNLSSGSNISSSAPDIEMIPVCASPTVLAPAINLAEDNLSPPMPHTAGETVTISPLTGNTPPSSRVERKFSITSQTCNHLDALSLSGTPPGSADSLLTRDSNAKSRSVSRKRNNTDMEDTVCDKNLSVESSYDEILRHIRGDGPIRRLMFQNGQSVCLLLPLSLVVLPIRIPLLLTLEFWFSLDMSSFLLLYPYPCFLALVFISVVFFYCSSSLSFAFLSFPLLLTFVLFASFAFGPCFSSFRVTLHTVLWFGLLASSVRFVHLRVMGFASTLSPCWFAQWYPTGHWFTRGFNEACTIQSCT